MSKRKSTKREIAEAGKKATEGMAIAASTAKRALETIQSLNDQLISISRTWNVDIHITKDGSEGDSK